MASSMSAASWRSHVSLSVTSAGMEAMWKRERSHSQPDPMIWNKTQLLSGCPEEIKGLRFLWLSSGGIYHLVGIAKCPPRPLPVNSCVRPDLAELSVMVSGTHCPLNERAKEFLLTPIILQVFKVWLLKQRLLHDKVRIKSTLKMAGHSALTCCSQQTCEHLLYGNTALHPLCRLILAPDHMCTWHA